MRTLPTAPLVAAGLVGGFAVARYTGRREIGGAVFAAAGAACAWSWLRSSGPGVTGVLVGTYAAAMGGSHPLAKKVGPWPSVLIVSAVSSAAALALADRSRKATRPAISCRNQRDDRPGCTRSTRRAASCSDLVQKSAR